MPKTETTTTVKNVTLDTVAALAMFAGEYGDDGVTIEEVLSGDRDDKLVVTLSDGAKYELQVREL